jgi:hypothetical protein
VTFQNRHGYHARPHMTTARPVFGYRRIRFR